MLVRNDRVILRRPTAPCGSAHARDRPQGIFLSVKKKILLVDDDPAVRRMLGRVLADADYIVIPAADFGEALKTAASRGIDLVLLDLNLAPGQAYESLRLIDQNPDLPVIVTARSGQLLPSVADKVGLYMEKPLDLPRLLRAIRELLARARTPKLAYPARPA
jgi:two-component system KDP operon response regulator KdpE